MKFSTKTRYGIRTMMEIAVSQENGILQKDISVKQDISVKYLDQIINSLKIAGLIANVHGKKSGYRLTRDASMISIYDIHKAFDSDICAVECLDGHYKCKRQEHCIARGFWAGLNAMVVDYFKNTTLQDLLEKEKSFK